MFVTGHSTSIYAPSAARAGEIQWHQSRHKQVKDYISATTLPLYRICPTPLLLHLTLHCPLQSNDPMPTSITLTVSHLPSSTSFFLSALQPLNYVFRGRQDHTIGFGPAYPPTTPADFWITQEIPGVPAGAAHVAFPATSRTQVQDFFLAALKAGGKIHGEPCQRDASGYYSAAVIDFDGNSIEAVYRPGFGDEGNKENVDARSMVSHRSGSVKAAPSTVAKSVVSAKAPTTVVSQAKSNTPSHVSTNTPEKTQPKPRPQGDILNTLINEARSAANVARDLVNTMKPNLSSSSTTASPATTSNGGGGGGSGAGEAIVGTLLGVAAGAALHYAFSNRSKESTDRDDDHDEAKSHARRPFVMDRSVTEPATLRPHYSSTTPSAYHDAPGPQYRAIEPAPSAYTYTPSAHDSQPRLITMHDNDPHPSPSALGISQQSDYASTIRPASRRRMSIDSGFGPGPRDRDLDRERDKDTASHASSKASRHSKKSTALPPTSYRAPTALTEAEGKSKAGGGPGSVSGSRTGSRARSRARSLSRIIGLDSQADDKSARGRSRSQSRHTHGSRRSRRDEFDQDEAETVLHVTESSHHTTSHPMQAATFSEHDTASKAGSKAPSRASSKHSHPRSHASTRRDRDRDRDVDPAEYPLPPSRAATWAGSDGASFVSARSKLGLSPTKHVDGPRTIIGRLNPLRHSASGGGRAADTASVVSKQQDLARLDVTDREVGPEDSVSQISVGSSSRRSAGGRSKASRR